MGVVTRVSAVAPSVRIDFRVAMPTTMKSSSLGAVRIASTVAERRRQSDVEVRCVECGERYTLSARRALEYRREGREPRCRECRRPARQPPSAADRRYWLERFTLEEIKELANAIWGERRAG